MKGLGLDVLEVLGLAAALAGLVAVVVGVAMLSVPAAWVVGGILAAVLGVVTVVGANRADVRRRAAGGDGPR